MKSNSNMLLEHNRQPMSVRHGKVFMDGVAVLDSVKFSVKFTPVIWEGSQLNDLTPSTRWLGYKVTGSMTRYRTTPWVRDMVKEFIKTGRTPEFTIQGELDDPGSDYGAAHGAITVTVIGVVFTGDLNLLELDASGNEATEEVNFNAKAVI